MHNPIKHAYQVTLGLEDGRVVVDVLDEDRDGEVGGAAVPPVARQPEPSQYNSYTKKLRMRICELHIHCPMW